MGNAIRKGEGSSSGQQNDELDEAEIMDYTPNETAVDYHAQDAYSHQNPMVNHQPSLLFGPHLPDNMSGLPVHLEDFETPPSPPSSYNNEFLPDADFNHLPPSLPPQLKPTPKNVPPISLPTSDESLPLPRQTSLNHLYIHTDRRSRSRSRSRSGSGSGSGSPVALGSTFRFRQKYVSVVLYTPSRKSE